LIMNSKELTAAAVTMSSIFLCGVASAQDRDRERAGTLDPATGAVELTIGTGYAQGFGNVASGQPSLTDVARAGGAVQGGVGYRILPELTLGVYGAGGMFGRGDQVSSSADLFTATAGIQADWHFLPSAHELDPWVSLGTGWRGYWVHADQGDTSLQGMELAKLQLGVDYRLDKAIAVSPVIGGDISAFFTESTPTSGGFHSVASPEVNAFVFAGVLGRFDIPTGSASGSSVGSR
jgi:hypothetical protein